MSAGESSEPQELADVAEGDQVPYYCRRSPCRQHTVIDLGNRTSSYIQEKEDRDQIRNKHDLLYALTDGDTFVRILQLDGDSLYT